MEQNNITEPTEIDVLKKRADMLGIQYHPSIGLDKLKEKVNAAMNDEADTDAPEVTTPVVKAETDNAKRLRLINDARALIRVRVSCMNPNKKEWDGELFTCGNSLVGSYKKFVPFNDTEDGYHIPRIIYDMLQERKCQIFYTVTLKNGMKQRRGKLIKEFNIEVLPQLTEVELKELAQRQAMGKTIGD